MKTFLNVIWHIPFLGFVQALAYFFLGLFFCITIIGIPVGLGMFQISRFMLTPFSSSLVSRSDLAKLTGKKQNMGTTAFNTVVRILYFIPGLLCALSAIAMIVIQFVTIIGIPCGIAFSKALGAIFNPVNKVCVPVEVGEQIKACKTQNYIDKRTVDPVPVQA